MKTMVSSIIGTLLVVCVALWVGSYFGVLQFWPAEAAAEGRLKKRALDIFEKKETGVDAVADFEAAARLHKQAKQELVKHRGLIDGQETSGQQSSSQTTLSTPSPSATSLGSGKWQVVLPGNLEYHSVIPISVGQTAYFLGWAGEVKLNPQEIFTNPPSGRYPTDKVTMAGQKAWVRPSAYTGALLAKVSGQDYAEVGGRAGNSFKATRDGEIVLSVNCLADEHYFGSGSYTGTVEVR
jgi:hypothetical protein